MKYGNFLENNKELAWNEFYMDYENLKQIIFDLASKNNLITTLNDKKLSQEIFFKILNSELRKVEEFTKKKVCFIKIIIIIFLNLSLI
jgi:SPX domain protein involved in polyphosphate accumulation